MAKAAAVLYLLGALYTRRGRQLNALSGQGFIRRIESILRLGRFNSREAVIKLQGIRPVPENAVFLRGKIGQQNRYLADAIRHPYVHT